MARVVWGGLFLAGTLLAAFIVYLGATGEGMLLKGLTLGGGILALSLFPLSKLMKASDAKDPS